MKADVRLTEREIAQYARHRLLRLDLDDLWICGKDSFDGIVLDMNKINVIALPACYWKRGAIIGQRLENPRLYVASYEIWQNGRVKQLPRDIQHFASGQVLEGFRLRINRSFWNVEPIYGE